MRIPGSWQSISSIIAFLILGTLAVSAHADPIAIPGYTVTDLGPNIPTFSTDANGNGVLNASNGQIFAFPQTPSTVLTPYQGIMATLPSQLLNAPINNEVEGYGDVGYSHVTQAIMNSSGLVAVNVVTGNGGYFDSTEYEYLIQRNPNGTWGQPVLAYASPQPSSTGDTGFNVVGLSKANEVLIQNGNLVQYGESLVYNFNTNSLIDLRALLLSAKFPYYGLDSLAIDDVGRILLRDQVTFHGSGPNAFDYLLLTPDDISSTSIEVAAPEPGALAVMVLAMAGLITHRICERRRLVRSGLRVERNRETGVM